MMNAMKNLVLASIILTSCDCSGSLQSVREAGNQTWHCANVATSEQLSDVKHHLQELVVSVINDASNGGAIAVAQKVLSVIGCIEQQGAQCPVIRDTLTQVEQYAIDRERSLLHGFLGCVTGEAFAALMHGSATVQDARSFANALTWTPDPPRASYATLANAWEDVHFAMYEKESFQTPYGVMK